MRRPAAKAHYATILALVALSLLLLQPACDLFALQSKGSQSLAASLLHHASDVKAECCEALQPSAHGSELAAAARAVTGASAAVAAISVALAVPGAAFVFRAAPSGAAPPPPRSYYARTARILR